MTPSLQGVIILSALRLKVHSLQFEDIGIYSPSLLIRIRRIWIDRGYLLVLFSRRGRKGHSME